MIDVLDLPLFAPVPIGHRVSIVPLEVAGLLSSSWSPLRTPLVCDENTRIIYADRSVGLGPETTYDRIVFRTGSVRISTSEPVKRGVVVSCIALSDSGSSVFLHTILRVDTAPSLT